MLALAVAGIAQGQAVAAGEENFVLAQGLHGGGIGASSQNNRSQASLGQSIAGAEAVSANFILQTGVSWMKPAVESDHPIVVGTRPSVGELVGGETVSVLGYNLSVPSSGPLSIEFAGRPGVGTAVTSNLQATTQTPSGSDAVGNPFGPVAVEVGNFLGRHEAPGAFQFTPSLTRVTRAVIGERVRLRIRLDTAGAFYVLAMGLTQPGISVPIWPFEGQLAVVLGPRVVVSLTAVPTGQRVKSFKIPDDPTLVGTSLDFQGLSVDGALAGGKFTNTTRLTFETTH